MEDQEGGLTIPDDIGADIILDGDEGAEEDLNGAAAAAGSDGSGDDGGDEGTGNDQDDGDGDEDEGGDEGAGNDQDDGDGDGADVFADFKIDDEEEIPPAEEAGENEVIKNLGIENVASVVDLKGHIANLQVKAESLSTEEITDTELSEHISNLKSLNKTGGNWRAYRDSLSELTNLDSQINQLNADNDYYAKVAYTGTQSEQKQFLVDAKKARLFANLKTVPATAKDAAKKKISGLLSDYSDKLEEFEESEITSQVIDAVSAFTNGNQKTLSDLTTKRDDLKAKNETAVSESKKNFEMAKTAMTAEITNYKSDVKTITPHVQKAARSLYNTDPTQVTLPQGLVKQLFHGPDGKFDPKKVLHILETSLYGKQKMDFLLKKAEVASFRKKKGIKSADPKGEQDKKSTIEGGYDDVKLI